MTKSYALAGAVALALGAIAGGVAIAQQTPQPRPAMAERVSRADFAERRVERLTAIDADRDGQVTADERRAGFEMRRAERMDRRFASLDANRDGSITRAEFDARHAERGDRPGRRADRRQARLDRMDRTITVADARGRAEQAFDRLDKDRDGYLTREERRSGRRAHRGPRAPSPAGPPAPQE